MQLIVSVFGTILTYGLYVVLRLLYSQYTSTFRIVPGPPPSSWWTGNFNEILATVCSLLSDTVSRLFICL